MNKQNMKIIYTLILTISFHQAFSHEPRFESAAIVSGISINLNQTENLLIVKGSIPGKAGNLVSINIGK